MNEESTCVFLDVRDFTNLLAENTDNDSFYTLLETVYSEGLRIGKELSVREKYYINSTGDGFLALFFGEHHYIKAYLFALIIQTKLPKFFEEIFMNKKEDGDYWFGVGIESGQVRQVQAKCGEYFISTYLGNVINIAARLENLTKDHARSPILFGPMLNEHLVKILFNVSYFELMNSAKQEKNSEIAKKKHAEMSDMNSCLMSSYIFEHKIKGVKNPLPVFRISPTLEKLDSPSFKLLLESFPKYIVDAALGII
jgi:hypothetical protein